MLAGVFAALSVLAACGGGPGDGPGGGPGDGPERSAGAALPPPATYAEALREATNDARREAGVEPLTPSPCARRWATRRAEALVGEALSHAPMTEVTAECAPGGRAAENLVDSAAAPAEVVEAWMGSAGHRNNIVDPGLREVGVGCVDHDGEMLCAQVFLGQE